jgi:hypothetical protein
MIMVSIVLYVPIITIITILFGIITTTVIVVVSLLNLSLCYIVIIFNINIYIIMIYCFYHHPRHLAVIVVILKRSHDYGHGLRAFARRRKGGRDHVYTCTRAFIRKSFTYLCAHMSMFDDNSAV